MTTPVRVLLVGDGAAMPKIHQRLVDGVADGRYEVDGVETLADGFGAIVAAEYDVYVVDHYVGVRTGFDLLARINEEGIKAPIVFVAGASDHGTGVTAVGAGAACYIVEDAIESDLLGKCLVQAMEQQTTLSQLNQAGVTVEGVPPTKAQILSHIAERLRNPAAEILDAARDSLMYALPAHTVESLASIEDQANGLLTLANDLVDLSMLEAGHLEFAAAEFSLRGLVSNVKRLLDPATNRTRSTSSTTSPTTCPTSSSEIPVDSDGSSPASSSPSWNARPQSGFSSASPWWNATPQPSPCGSRSAPQPTKTPLPETTSKLGGRRADCSRLAGCAGDTVAHGWPCVGGRR